MKTFLKIAFLFLGINVPAQNEFSKWYFGYYTGLDFMTNPPSVINHSTMNTNEGSASAADGAGNLLFYTDGSVIWNNQQLVMANGTGLLGTSSTVQSALIAKQPGTSNIYFVFTLDMQGGANGLRYSVVDMSLAAGMGSVTVKNVPVITPCTEQLSGARHCNGIDLWIVTHDFNSNKFFSYLLTAGGLSPTPVVSSIGPAPPMYTPNNMVLGQGTIKISPTGKKLGMTFFNGLPNSEVAIFDFDKSTGAVSNYLSLITGTVNYYGCEFSGDGTKFYTAASGAPGPLNVYQWDLCAGSDPLILASKTAVASSTIHSGQLQLAPNGKIYIVNWNTQSLAAINNPDLAGTACNYIAVAQSVANGTNGAALPTFIGGVYKSLPAFTYTFNPLISCNTVSFTAPSNPTINAGCGASGYPVQSILWNFGQPLSVSTNTSNLNKPIHNFGAPGTYTVKLVLNYQCGADTLYERITIPGPTIAINSSIPSCSVTGNATVNITGEGGPFSYTWLPSGQTTQVATVSAGTYTVHIHDIGGNCDYVTHGLIVPPVPLPQLTVTGYSYVCPGSPARLVASGAFTYTWSTGANTASIAVNPVINTTYTVSATDVNGCFISSIFNINVKDSGCIYVDAGCPGNDLSMPNAFTPNGDGCNDKFSLQGWNICIEKFSVQIFNRWGEKVYGSDDPSFSWDGILEGEPLASDVFIYVISASFTDGHKEIKKGNISLLR